jgi:hypothetical protein
MTRRLCCPLTIVLALVVAALVYVFAIRGQVLPASDGRTVVLLAPGERDLVLTEMRDFLVALQQISQSIADGDATRAVQAARRVGGASQHQVPPGLVGKLPLAFKRLGFDTHSGFDELALNIEQFGDTAQALPELAALMKNCIACHAAYRIDLEPQ